MEQWLLIYLQFRFINYFSRYLQSAVKNIQWFLFVLISHLLKGVIKRKLYEHGFSTFYFSTFKRSAYPYIQECSRAIKVCYIYISPQSL